jgi:hypothetical protein
MANKSECSDGEMITQDQIDRRLAKCHREMYIGEPHPICGCGCGERAVDNDHTIAKARCKVIRKAELIYDPDNNVPSCRKAHKEWENVKGLKWVDHANVLSRLMYLKKHDPEGYRYRMEIAA